jgi:hypothetical protein
MANNSGKATKGGAAAPGVNVNGCQCESVKFLMASDIGRRAKVPSPLASQLMFVLCLYDKHTTQVQSASHTCSIGTLTRLPSHKTFALWTHSRITSESQVSSFESSLSEEQMRGRRRFCRTCATTRRSRKYLGLVHGKLAIRTIGYVLVPRGTFVLIISPG